MLVRIANREDPAQTASSGPVLFVRISLMWVCGVCLGCFGKPILSSKF